MSTTLYLDQVQQLRELNRAFLSLLQERVQADRPCFGLPANLRPQLRAASGEFLDAVAEFPQALFRLSLQHTVSVPPDESEHALALSILLAARYASRQSSYHARLLLGLEAPEVPRMVALTLADLRRLAATPALLHCALTDRQWFWQGLLTASRPETRQQLTLMALQPAADPGWPQRRPPHSTR
jgi:hypothetical protein